MHDERTTTDGGSQFAAELVGRPPMSADVEMEALFVGFFALCDEMGGHLGGRLSVDEALPFMTAADAMRLAWLMGTARIDGVNGQALSQVAKIGSDYFVTAGERGKVLLQAYIDALGSMDYHTYLKTRQWHHVRWVALAVARRRCQVCDHAGRLEVHHRTYERRGMESADDVTVLCRDCHGAHHERTRARR